MEDKYYEEGKFYYEVNYGNTECYISTWYDNKNIYCIIDLDCRGRMMHVGSKEIQHNNYNSIRYANYCEIKRFLECLKPSKYYDISLENLCLRAMDAVALKPYIPSLFPI